VSFTKKKDEEDVHERTSGNPTKRKDETNSFFAITIRKNFRRTPDQLAEAKKKKKKIYDYYQMDVSYHRFFINSFYVYVDSNFQRQEVILSVCIHSQTERRGFDRVGGERTTQQQSFRNLKIVIALCVYIEIHFVGKTLVYNRVRYKRENRHFFRRPVPSPPSP